MATLRERFVDLFPGPKTRRQLREATETLWNVYQKRNLLGGRAVSEYDPRTFDQMVRHLNDAELTSSMNVGEPEEDERRKAVDEARYLYQYDVTARHGIRLWTNYGLGTDPQIIVRDAYEEPVAPVEITPENPALDQVVPPATPDMPMPSDATTEAIVPNTISPEVADNTMDDAASVWNECWTARRNAPLFRRRRLGRMSDKVLVEGELFFAAFYNTKDTNEMSELIASDLDIEIIPKGASTIRLIDTDQITEFLSDPNDEESVGYYKREWYDAGTNQQKTLYYKAWGAHKSGALKRIKLPDGAKVQENCYVLHAEHNTIYQRGWPITSSSAPWLRAYKKFMQDRVTVAASKAMFVRRFITEGGSRAVDAVRNFFSSTYQSGGSTESNPAAVAGSSLVTNKALDMQDLPLTTGAGDAQTDGAAIIAQAALGFSAFPHYFGHGEAFRLATTTAMEAPMMRVWGAYQQWWSDVLTELVDMVVGTWEETNDIELPDYRVSVQIDPLVDVDLTKFSGALAPLFQIGLIPEDQGMLLALQAFGVEHPHDVVDAVMRNRAASQAMIAQRAVVPEQMPEPRPEIPPELAQEIMGIAALAREMMAKGEGGAAAQILSTLDK